MEATLDPGISEWGNPIRVMSYILHTEYIGIEEQTEGTETSKYLVEKKTIVISRVAASEKETV